MAFRRKLRRGQVLGFLAGHPRCVVAMEACASAHHWGREIEALGHEARLIAPAYVKPFVKRQKNDMADAEAIAEAASRPTMRFVAVKSEQKQAAGLTFKTRDLLVRQRSQAIAALRGHLAEYGLVAPQGVAQLPRFEAALKEAGPDLPTAVSEIGLELLSHIEGLNDRIDALSARLRTEARRDETARRLMTIIRHRRSDRWREMAHRGPGLRRGPGRAGPADRELLEGARLRSLDRPRAPTDLVGRQSAAGADLEDGATRPQAPADHRGDVGRALAIPAWRACGILACADARDQAQDAGRGRAGQQDRPRRMGAHARRRGVRGSGRRLIGGRTVGGRRRV